MNKKYEFIVSDDKKSCVIFSLRPYKRLGTVTLTNGTRSIQTFSHGVEWLPVYKAMEAMGVISEEESILGQLGVL
jgi:hypothetical protein